MDIQRLRLPAKVNTSIIVICLLLVAFVLCSLFFMSTKEEDAAKAKDGFLDLSGMDFSKDSAVYLSGEWTFYYGKFIDPLDADAAPDGVIDVPELWNSFQYNGKAIGADGYGTYRLKVKLPGGLDTIGLKLPSMSSCYKLYINGRLVSQNGEPGTSEQAEVPQWKPQTAFYPPSSDTLDIVVHVSNFHHAKGGMWGNILLGNQQEIIKYRDVNLMRSYILLGVFCIVAVFMLILSLIEKNFPCLYLALYCFASALRELTVREVAIWTVAGSISFDVLPRLEYITMPLGLLFYTLFIHHLYPKQSVRKIFIALLIACGVLIALPLITETRVFSLYVRVYMAFALFTFVYSAFVVARNLLKGHLSSGVVLAGVLILIFATINDTLYIEKISNRYGAAHFYAIAFAVFLVCQIYMVFVNIAGHYKRAREAAEAQLTLLQSQIKPHFLFNVLNTIHQMIDENPSKAKKTLDALSDYLRGKFKYSFDPDPGFIPLREEIDALKSYVYIANTRFDGRVDLQVNIPEKHMETKIPAFLLQPIVENSIRHGMGEGKLHIAVSAIEDASDLLLSIRDDGVGMSRIELYNLFESKPISQSESNQTGVGLKNVRMRMQLYYGRDIEIRSETDKGTEVVFFIPLSK